MLACCQYGTQETLSAQADPERRSADNIHSSSLCVAIAAGSDQCCAVDHAKDA